MSWYSVTVHSVTVHSVTAHSVTVHSVAVLSIGATLHCYCYTATGGCRCVGCIWDPWGKLGSETPTHKPRGSERAKKRRIFSAKANSYRIIGQGMKSLGKIFIFDTQSKMSLL